MDINLSSTLQSVLAMKASHYIIKRRFYFTQHLEGVSCLQWRARQEMSVTHNFEKLLDVGNV